MKLAGIWTIFNGLELLQDSVDNVAPFLDEIIIIDQDVSFHGEPKKESYLIRQPHHHLEYKCDPKKFSKTSEIEKHTMAVEKAKELGCTHFIILAVDHFYDYEEFKKAKEDIELMNYDTSCTKLLTYYKTTEYVLDPLEGYYCPFINKIVDGFQFGKGYPVYVDPAIAYFPCSRIRIFAEYELVLHHLSWVRSEKEIRSKIRNAASRRNWKDKEEDILNEWINFDPEKPLTYYPEHRLKKVSPFNIKNKIS